MQKLEPLSPCLAALLLLSIGLFPSCTQYNEGRRIKEAKMLASKSGFQFFAQRAFAVEREAGNATAIVGQVVEGFATPGDTLLIETSAGLKPTSLLAIEDTTGPLEAANPRTQAALIFRGIDPKSIRPGSLIVMAPNAN